MEGMRFIYSLSDKGRVFYVGMTKDLHKRYTWHCNASSCSFNTYKYIHVMLKKGRLPTIHIIDYLPYELAGRREAEIIQLFATAGHSLTNDTFNYNKLVTSIPLPVTQRKTPFKRGQLDYIKEMQEQYIEHYNYTTRLKNG